MAITYLSTVNVFIACIIFQVQAKDSDCGANGQLTYSLDDGNVFSVDSSTGQMCLSSVGSGLDRESRQAFSLMVTAADRGGLSASALITVSVTDINDNAPVFAPADYTLDLGEATSGPVLTVQATDAEDGGDVRYDISSGNEDGAFSLDPETGVLYVKDGGRPDARIMTVDAVDSGGKISGNQAKVTVRPGGSDVYQFKFVVAEDVSPYSDVGRVEVSS